MTIIDGFTVVQRGGMYYASMTRGREIHRLWPAKTLLEIERAITEWWLALDVGW